MLLLQQSGEWDQAIKLSKELMPLVKRKFSKDHPLYIKTSSAKLTEMIVSLGISKIWEEVLKVPGH